MYGAGIMQCNEYACMHVRSCKQACMHETTEVLVVLRPGLGSRGESKKFRI